MAVRVCVEEDLAQRMNDQTDIVPVQPRPAQITQTPNVTICAVPSAKMEYSCRHIPCC